MRILLEALITCAEAYSLRFEENLIMFDKKKPENKALRILRFLFFYSAQTSFSKYYVILL